MLTLRSSSAFPLFERIEHQLSQQLQNAERVPAAEVHETAEAYEVVLELPGVDRDSLDVQATDRTLVVSAERRSQQEIAPEAASEGEATARPGSATLISEFRYGSWSRSFRFPNPVDCDKLQARYRDGLLCITAPKAQKVNRVSVTVEG
ncbi:MAG: Hsp20/alpha crystallin family protein [Synechococcus sp.]